MVNTGLYIPFLNHMHPKNRGLVSRWKCRSQNSDKRDRWRSRGGNSQREEVKKREDQRRERVKAKKMQVREKVGKSRITVFFHDLWPGSVKICTPSGQIRHENLHTVVARSTFGSQNVQSSAPDHFWKLRCRKSACRCGAKHMSKSKVLKNS